MGRFLKQLVVLLAFAGAMIAPRFARAAILPACEMHELTRMPVEWLTGTPSEDCSSDRDHEAAPSEDQPDSKVAAMCDNRGASVVAPGRVLNVGDARLDAAARRTIDRPLDTVSPGPQDAPLAGSSFALAEHATLGATPIVPPAYSELAPPFVAALGGPLAGFGRLIDHPPR